MIYSLIWLIIWAGAIWYSARFVYNMIRVIFILPLAEIPKAAGFIQKDNFFFSLFWAIIVVFWFN